MMNRNKMNKNDHLKNGGGRKMRKRKREREKKVYKCEIKISYTDVNLLLTVGTEKEHWGHCTRILLETLWTPVALGPCRESQELPSIPGPGSLKESAAACIDSLLLGIPQTTRGPRNEFLA